MAPIDPNSLLRAFEPWLTPEGGIRNVEEVPRLSSLMSKYSKKLVSRCIYLNVLLNTKEEVLNKFLEQDGWETINSWLNMAKESDTSPFLLELLKLFERCPVTVERLKQNNTARLIKSLSKESSGEVAVESKRLVSKWTIVIKSSSKVDSNEKKAKKKDGKRKDSVSRSNNSESDEGDQSTEKKRRKLENSDKSTNSAATEATNKDNGVGGTINGTTANEVNNVLGLATRPLTVRVKQNTSRSIGIEIPSSTDRKATTKLSTSPTSTVNNFAYKLAPSNSAVTPPASENKVAPLRIKLDPKDKTTGIKVIDPLPMPPTLAAGSSSASAKAQAKLTESAFFMDAILPQTETPLRKKKKVVPSPTATKTTQNGSAPQPDGVAESDDISKRIEMDMQSTILTEDTTDELYQEPTNDVGTDDSRSFTPPPVALAAVTPSMSTVASAAATMTPGPSKSFPRGCLLFSKSSSAKKKGVRWLPDMNIKDVRFFDVDENERTNVFREAMDKRGEGNAFLHKEYNPSSQNPEKAPMELFRWSFQPFSFPEDFIFFEKGKESKEREIQSQRQRAMTNFVNVLADFPSEPDAFEALASAHEAPKLIPLQDANNQVHDYSGTAPALSSQFTNPQPDYTQQWPASPYPVPQTAFGSQPPQVYVQSSYNVDSYNGGYQQSNNNHVQSNFASRGSRPPRPESGNFRGRGGRGGSGPRYNNSKVCVHFLKTGVCKFDTRCNFVHTRDANHMLSRGSRDRDSGRGTNGWGSSNDQQDDWGTTTASNSNDAWGSAAPDASNRDNEWTSAEAPYSAV